MVALPKPQPEPTPQPVAPSDALQRLLGQLEDLVKLSLDAEKKEFAGDAKKFAEVHAELRKMHQIADAMSAGYREALKSVSLSEEDTKRFRENLQGREKKMSDTIQGLIEECEGAKQRAYQALQRNRSVVNEVNKELGSEKQKGRDRRDRFKSVGGKKGWMKT